MSTTTKKGIFWGVIITSSALVINTLHFIFGGSSAFARAPHGPDGMGHPGGFGGHHMMNDVPHNGGFPWLPLIIGVVILVLIVIWFKKKSKTSSMQQFIDTSLAGSHIPVTNQHSNVLDQWEKNLLTKKENK